MAFLSDVAEERAVVCVLFGSAAALAGRALCSISSPAARGPVGASSATGLRMRRALAIGLMVANIVRCLALVFEISLEDGEPQILLNRLDDAQMRWLLDLVQLLPAAVFLSAFSIVVLFWAQLHYTTTIVPLPLLDCLFVCVNITCYLLVAAIAVCTFLLQAYRHLRPYMVCIIGFLNAVVALSLAYYGLMVFFELAETSRKKLPGKRLGPRVVAVSIICPIALLVRGGVLLACGLSIEQPPSEQVSLALCVGGEWLPSVATLVLLNPLNRTAPKSPTDSLDDSTDSEAPLLHDDNMASQRKGAPGLTWKQLYPQP